MNGATHANSMVVDDARSSRSRTPRAPPREMQTPPGPESVRSSASRKQPSALGSSASQTNLAVEQQYQKTPRQQASSSSALGLLTPVRHSTSRVSLREAGSFANGFDDGAYLDPAFYPSDGPVTGDGHGHGSQVALHGPSSRPVSRGTSSVLSYI